MLTTGRQPIRRRPGRLGRTSGATGVTDLSGVEKLARAVRPTEGKQVRVRRLTTTCVSRGWIYEICLKIFEYQARHPLAVSFPSSQPNIMNNWTDPFCVLPDAGSRSGAVSWRGRRPTNCPLKLSDRPSGQSGLELFQRLPVDLIWPAEIHKVRHVSR